MDNLICGKYWAIRKLAKGELGEVFLVTEKQNEHLWALKIVDKKKMAEADNLKDYFLRGLEFMKTLNSPYMAKLQHFFEDDDNYYMALEYYDDGDLVSFQAKQPNRVFPLSLATLYLRQVILGLEQLHKIGYIHRDLKGHHVLVKTVNGRKICNITGFTFAKKKQDVKGTVLGTQRNMAPEIFYDADNLLNEPPYGKQVDMWAFEVMFFFMMNMQFPFNINPHRTTDEKYIQLCKLANNFSYREAVQKTKKKKIQNCSDEVEDLFRRIFCIGPKKRITFSQIKQHPVFISFFYKPPIQKILYIKGNKLLEKVKQIAGNSQSVKTQSRVKIFTFQNQNSLIRGELEDINFLLKIIDQFEMVNEYIDPISFLMFAFNLTKYNIFLLNNHYNSLKISKYQIKHPQLDWSNFFITQKFANNKRNESMAILNSEERYNQLYGECKKQYKEICKLNEYFASSFQNKFDIDENFFRSYRRSIQIIYGALKFHLKTKQLSEIYSCIFMAYIAQIFDKLYDNEDLKHSKFYTFFSEEAEVYFSSSNFKAKQISYYDIAQYIRKCNNLDVLKHALKTIDAEMSK